MHDKDIGAKTELEKLSKKWCYLSCEAGNSTIGNARQGKNMLSSTAGGSFHFWFVGSARSLHGKL